MTTRGERGYLAQMDSFPLPGTAPAAVVAPAPGRGPQFWTGAPSAVLDDDGAIVLGYRVRNGPDTVDETVVARSADGEAYTTIFALGQDHFGAQWTKRPALVRFDGGWRMYMSLATPGTKHWSIGVVTAPTLSELASAPVETAFAGDRDTAVKDPIVKLIDGAWHAWICCHLLDLPGHEDRMNSAYATSADGLELGLARHRARGPHRLVGLTRRATLHAAPGRPGGACDGRASAEENWFERTGLATRAGDRYASTGDPVADVRYLEALPLPAGGYRIFYEARLGDETHELRTELCAS